MSIEILDPAMRPKRPWRPGEAFEPNSWPQERFLVSESPELLFSGHRGSAKTRTVCEKADMLCRSYPGARVVLSRKKREHMGKSVLTCLLEEVISPSHRSWGWRPAADGGSTLHYPNGSEVLCAGLDNPGRMLSGEFMANYTDQAEELEEDEYLAIGGSLRQNMDKRGKKIPFHQNGGACNPEGPAHFLFKRFRPDLASHGSSYVMRSDAPLKLASGRVIPAGRELREVIVSGLLDNLGNLPDEYQEWLASLTGRYRERFALGLWVAFDGYVFDCYDPRVHEIEAPAEWAEWGGYPPPTWKRFRGIDFGFTNPFVFQWWARSPQRTWYLYREVYHSQRFIKQHRETIRHYEAEELEALNAAIATKRELQLEAALGLPSLEPLRRLSFANTFADSENAENRALLDELGIPSNAAVKDVEAGIQTVYELLSPKRDPATNRVSARMYLVNGACRERDQMLRDAGKPTCTAEEFPLYQRERRRHTEKDMREAEAPKKGNDHGIDTTRYVLHSSRVFGDQRVIRLFDRQKNEQVDW